MTTFIPNGRKEEWVNRVVKLLKSHMHEENPSHSIIVEITESMKNHYSHQVGSISPQTIYKPVSLEEMEGIIQFGLTVAILYRDIHKKNVIDYWEEIASLLRGANPPRSFVEWQ